MKRIAITLLVIAIVLSSVVACVRIPQPPCDTSVQRCLLQGG